MYVRHVRIVIFQTVSIELANSPNWDLGVPTSSVDATISGNANATIQSGTAAEGRRVFVRGGGTGGTLIVNGTLQSLWNGDGLAVGTATGHGTVQVIGGTINPTGSRDLELGATTAGYYGTVQIGDGSTSGTANFRNVSVTANAADLSLLDLQNGTLDVSSILSLGATDGTIDSVRMILGGTSTLNALNLNVGVTADTTSARLDVNGSGVTVTTGNMSLVNGSQINFNFADSGISTLTATKLWYGTTVDVNVNGTENVNPGSYELFVGTAGGTTNETLAFNISGFNSAYSTEVVKTIDGGTGTLAYTLNVNADTNAIPDSAILVEYVSNGVFYVSSTNLAVTGTNYLQASDNLVIGGWSNISHAVGVTSTNWPVAPAMTSEFFRILWQ